MNKFISQTQFLNKKKIINGWIHSSCTVSAEIIGASSFDSITIDLQHGIIDIVECKTIIQVLKKYNKFIIVRVPSNEIGIINKCLDAGANGIICPLVNNKADCLHFLKNCFYPDKGIRSFGPTISNIYYDDYVKKANDYILPFVMLETKESLHNLDEILNIKDLKLLYIGPYDLSINLGFKLDDVFKKKEMLSLYLNILLKAKKMGKKVAIHCSGGQTAKYFLKKGFDMVTLSTDLNLLKISIQQQMKIINGKK